MIKNISLILFVCIIGYLLITLLVNLVADSLIYLPPRPASYHDKNYDHIQYDNHLDHKARDIIKIKTSDGKLISALYLLNSNAHYTVLVSHGNAEDIGYLLPFLKQMHRHGFAVFAYDYHGYGTSEGKPNEKNSYADIDAAYDYLVTKLKIPKQQIIIYGRSLGSAVALDLAIRNKAAGLILEAPFLTIYRTVTHIPLFIGDQFNNLAKITKLTVPLLVIHGEKDRIVPIWHGKKLYQIATVPKQHLWIPNAGHNDLLLIAKESYWQSIANFIKSLP